MNSFIDQKQVQKLCSDYSKLYSADSIATHKTHAVREQLNNICAEAQKHFMRDLSDALCGTKCSILSCRVWNNINHEKNPVTVMPSATSQIIIRKGVMVELDFIASDLNIKAEINKLKAAITAFNN